MRAWTPRPGPSRAHAGGASRASNVSVTPPTRPRLRPRRRRRAPRPSTGARTSPAGVAAAGTRTARRRTGRRTSTRFGPPRAVGGRRRRSTGERVFRWAALVVALVLVAGGLGVRLPVVPAGPDQVGQVHGVRGRRRPAPPTTCSSWARTPGPATPAGRPRPSAARRRSGGQRSDTIKILHVDPAAGTARAPVDPARHLRHAVGHALGHAGWRPTTRSTPRSTVGRPRSIQTIENTFGIPINHFVITSFNGVIDLVQAVGGINLDFPYPVRDNDNGQQQLRARHHPLRLPDPERQQGPGLGPLALLPVRGPPRLLGVRRQRRPRPDPAPERHHRSGHRQGEVELQPLQGQRLPRFVVHDITKDNAMSTAS